MNLTLPDRRMSVDEFLDWSKRQERGKYELFDGVVVMQQSQRWRHARVKLEIAILLRQAVKQASLACYVAPDGMTVRPPSGGKAFEPDALLAALPEPDLDSLEVANPLIVIEVLSPSTAQVDVTVKLQAYFEIPTVEHYLVVDPDSRMVIHFRRSGTALETRIISDGVLALEHLGIGIDMAELFR